MKKILTILSFALVAFTLQAAGLKDKKIYIDPGHGSYGPNDRPMATIPYPMLSATGCPETGVGFYESNTNLWKCEKLEEMLIKAGAKTSMSHRACGGTTDGTSYNPSLSARRQEATSWGADFFISVHSNASSSVKTNFLYLALSGHSGVSSTLTAKQRKTAEKAWPYIFEAMGEGSNGYKFEPPTHYSYTNMKIETQSLGVMRHSIQGFLSEGYFHTYQPSRHRALNQDWCRQEGLRYYRGIAAFYGQAAETKGYIMGVVKSATEYMTQSETLTKTSWYYNTGTHDKFKPLHGAKVTLYKDGVAKKTYTTDNKYNGVFVFEDLEPGTYTLDVQCTGYGNIPAKDQKVVVIADKTVYPVILMPKGTYDPGQSGGTPSVKGIYAYGLKLTTATDAYTFSFTANDKPKSASLVFYKDGVEVGRKAIASVVSGANSVKFAKTDIPGTVGDVLTWAVELKGEEISNWDILKAESSYTRAFNTVDNSPESDYFGRIYVVDRVGADNVKNGVYAYKQDWERIETPVPPYQPSTDDQWRNPTRATVAPDGSLFVADWGDAHAGMWVASPGLVSGTYKQFFAGTKQSDGSYLNGSVYTGSCVVGCHVYGTGTNTKLIVYNEDAAGTLPANGIAIYNIGKADGTITSSWTTAPSKVIALPDASLTQPFGNVWGTSHGVFVSLNRETTTANTTDQPSLRFYDYDGTLQYTSAGVAAIQGSKGGGFAVSRDEKTLVINDAAGNFVVFTITWNGNKPTLTKTATYNHGITTHIRQMNFDYAGNLLVSGEGGFYIYSVPTTNNSTTTPAKKALTVIGGGGESTTVPDTPSNPEDPTEELPTGTITFSKVWSKTQAESGYLLTGDANRSMAYYNGTLYIPNVVYGKTSTFSVVNAADGTLKDTKTIGDHSFTNHNLRITEDGKLLLGNTGSAQTEAATVTVYESDFTNGGAKSIGSGKLSARGDFFYPYGKWNESGYLLTLANDVQYTITTDAEGKQDTTYADAVAVLKIPYSGGVLGTAERIVNSSLPVVGYSAKAIPSVDGKTFYASAVGVTPTEHDITTGDFVDGFGEQKPVQVAKGNTSGLAVFSIHKHTYMVTPLSRWGQFEIYDISLGLSQATKVTEVGTTADLGSTANGAALVDFATYVDGNDVYIYELVPNNGIAAYKFTFTPDQSSGNDDPTTNPDFTYGSVKFYLQGGKMTVPADNEALWNEMWKEFKAKYSMINYNASGFVTPDFTYTTSGYKSDGNHDESSIARFLQNCFYTEDNSKYTAIKNASAGRPWDTDGIWEWLGDYFYAVSATYPGEILNFCYDTQGFLQQQAAGTITYNKIDWTENGQPTAWQPAYIFGHEPTKTNDTFLGWFKNAEGTGSPLTTLPTSGNVYACWKSATTDVEHVESVVCIRPTFSGVEIFFEGKQTIAIYNINGMQIAAGVSTDYYACDLDRGMYIIRIDNEVYKYIKY